MPRIRQGAAFAVALLAIWSSPALSKVLITTAEARLPDDTFVRRDSFPGPKIILEIPPPNGGAASSPLHLRIRFEPRGAQIDPNTLYVRYKKLPAVDLTDRLREFTTTSGIDMQSAELPPGAHHISVDIKDADGASGHLDFLLSVTQ